MNQCSDAVSIAGRRAARDTERLHRPARVPVTGRLGLAACMLGIALLALVNEPVKAQPVIAVIDSGANLNHRDFANRIARGAYEVFGASGNAADVTGHGTAVASIIAAQKDPNPNPIVPLLLPIRVFDGLYATDRNIAAGLRYSIGRARIVNLSLAATAPLDSTAFKDSVAAGQLIVVAAGNNSHANPSWPARFAKEDWSRGRMIAVGAVDAGNVIAAFSNRAGDTKYHFLVAPGVNVQAASAFDANSHIAISGTSAAAPIVAGTAGLILARWPYLSALQVAGILFVTATDLGAPGVDEVYGWGLLNPARALQPVGQPELQLRSGVLALLRSATLEGGLIAGAQLRVAAARGELRSVALDSFGRGFYFDLAGGIAPARRTTSEQIFGAPDRLYGMARTNPGPETVLHYAIDTTNPQLPRGGMFEYEARFRAPANIANLALVQSLGPRSEWAAGTMGMAGSYLGLGAIDRQDTAPTRSTALSLPMLAMLPAHHHLLMGHAIDEGLKVKFGVLSTTGASALQEQFAPARRSQSSTNAAVLEVAKHGALGSVGVTAQRIQENDTYFGAIAGDAYRLSIDPITSAATVFGRLDFTRAWSIAGQYTIGSTPAVNNTTESLIARISAVRSEAFGIELVRLHSLVRNDRLSLALSQPLRAMSGEMTLDIPDTIDDTGAVVRRIQPVSLKPAGRERLTEFTYTRLLRNAASLSWTMIHRAEPNHDAGARSERIAFMRYATPF